MLVASPGNEDTCTSWVATFFARQAGGAAAIHDERSVVTPWNVAGVPRLCREPVPHAQTPVAISRRAI
jgi:hypothetical protein